MEIAITILTRLGISTKVEFVPFKRILSMLETGDADLTTTLKGSTFKPASLADLKGKTIGVVREFTYPAAFADDKDIKKSEAPNQAGLITMAHWTNDRPAGSI